MYIMPPKKEKERKHNQWIQFAQNWADHHHMALGCAIIDADCKREYNAHHKIVHSINHVPQQLRAWVHTSQQVAKEKHISTPCCYSNQENQDSYHNAMSDGTVDERHIPFVARGKVLAYEMELGHVLDMIHGRNGQPEANTRAPTFLTPLDKLNVLGEEIGRPKLYINHETKELVDVPVREDVPVPVPVPVSVDIPKKKRPRVKPNEVDPKVYNKLLQHEYVKYLKKKDRTKEEAAIMILWTDKLRNKAYKDIFLDNRDTDLEMRAYARRKLRDKGIKIPPQFERGYSIYKEKSGRGISHDDDDIQPEDLYLDSIDMTVSKRIPMRTVGGAMEQPARLGAPKNQVPNLSLSSSKKTPVPSPRYNIPFIPDSPHHRPRPKHLEKLVGYGMVSNRRDSTMFKNDSMVFPM